MVSHNLIHLAQYSIRSKYIIMDAYQLLMVNKELNDKMIGLHYKLYLWL